MIRALAGFIPGVVILGICLLSSGAPMESWRVPVAQWFAAGFVMAAMDSAYRGASRMSHGAAVFVLLTMAITAVLFIRACLYVGGVWP